MTVREREGEPAFVLQTQWGKTPLSLPGHRAAQNAATALTLFKETGYSPEVHLSALGQVRWPGRMERIQHPKSPCPIYLSGDHNPAGAASLLELLPHFRRRHLFILAGIGKDKDADGILSSLFSLENSSVFLTETPFRGRSLQDYGPWLKLARGAAQDPLQALHQIFALAREEDMILVTGSLYLVGFVRGGLL